MKNEKFVRQSFLGHGSQERIESCLVGIVGLGGGGSHIVQQLAHVGFQRYVIYDPDVVDYSNLNRLLGATEADAVAQRPKIEIAQRVVRGLQPQASIEAFRSRWQDNPSALRRCNIVFSCVDTFAERQELEVCARRYLIDYIDIGMDVHQVGDEPAVMGGQVILSLPGDLCMFCMGFLTEARLGQEAAQYGDVGGRPQVVWPNGVLASTAVGIAVDLVTDWTRLQRSPVYLSYNGNDGTLQPHTRMRFLKGTVCNHYPADQVGDPVFTEL